MMRALRLGSLFVVVAVGLLACPPPPVVEGEGEEGEGDEGEGEGEGGKAFGAFCEANDECDSGSCTAFFDVGDIARDVCTVACAADGDCAVSGFDGVCIQGVCLPSCDVSTDCDDAFAANDGAGVCRDVGAAQNACLPFAGARCGKDGDCADGEACTLFVGADDVSFACAPVAAVGQPEGAACDDTAISFIGVACNVDADCVGGATCPTPAQGQQRVCVLPIDQQCAGFFCADDVCSGSCAVDADCSAGSACVASLLTIGASSQLVPLCVPRAGSLTPCQREADCSDGEHCGFTNDAAGKQITACMAPNPGDVAFGDLCTDDFTTLDVIEPTNGCPGNCGAGDSRCGPLCTDDADCGAGACLVFEINDEDSVGICFVGARCTGDADCAAGQRCDERAVIDGIDHVCVDVFPGTLSGGDVCEQGVGLANVGVTCVDDDDCAGGGVCEALTRTCLGPIADLCSSGCSAFDLRCFEPCASDADCADHGPSGRCEGVRGVFDGNDAADDGDDELDVFGTCVDRPGSGAACTATRDCTGGEVCMPATNLAGAVANLCTTPLAGGVDVGAACGRLPDDSLDVCASGLCDGARDADGFFSGTCRGLCDADDDCTGGQRCQLVEDAIGVDQDERICK